ncbi:MAG: PAS domain-containing sensor histidine kinase [Flavobacteriales bacterium]|nr:PAS domain-containing sensor histidine kinase [Flavobacteriales bacterium]
MDFELTMMVGSITETQQDLFGKKWCDVIGRENVTIIQKTALRISGHGESQRFTLNPFQDNDALVHGELMFNSDESNDYWILHLSQGSFERWSSEAAEDYAQGSSALIYLYDLIDQRNVFSNREISSLLGYTTEEFRELPGGVLGLIHPDDLKGLGTHQRKLHSSNSDRPLYFEYAIKHKDGHYISLASWDRPYKRNSKGSVVQYLRITFELEKATFPDDRGTENGSKSPDVEWFAQMVAHDLKQPLVQIQGLAKLISRHLDAKDIDKTKKLLDMLITSSNNAQNLVNSMLQMSYANKDKLEKSEFDVGDLMEEVMSMDLGTPKPEDTQLKVQNDIPKIKVNRILFKQVLTNLVSNSLKFKAEVVPLIIKVEYQKLAEGFQIAIEDNGVGLNPEQDIDVFALFNKSVTHNKSGHGIGLSIVKRVIAKHGGSVNMKPASPHGVRIEINLPD